MSKVVLLAPLPPPMGGIAKWATRMQRVKMKNGWHVMVVDESDNKKEVYNLGSNSFFRNVWRCFSIWSRLRNALKDPDVKVVHSNIPANTLSMLRELICAHIAKRRDRKFVIHFHCTVPTTVKGRLGRFYLKKLCNISDGILVLNGMSRQFVAERTKTKVFLVPNFVESDLPGCPFCRRFDGVKRALYVGGIIEEKGCGTILQLALRFPEIQFRLVGLVSDDFKQKEAPANVVYPGVLTGVALADEYKQANVFLFFTYMAAEGFSLALTEAMAYGLPCIVTDWAANADMIQNRGGLVVPVRDDGAAERALRRLAEMAPQERRQMSEWNVEQVKSRYTAETVTSTYVDIYEQC